MARPPPTQPPTPLVLTLILPTQLLEAILAPAREPMVPLDQPIQPADLIHPTWLTRPIQESTAILMVPVTLDLDQVPQAPDTVHPTHTEPQELQALDMVHPTPMAHRTQH
jgi:hypothetical protein